MAAGWIDMTPTQKGILLGALNASVLALVFVLTMARDERAAEMFGIFLGVSIWLALPGSVIGAIVGRLAGCVHRFRLAVLAGAACAGMGLFGLGIAGLVNAPEFLWYVPLCCPPTIAMASVLERWTRHAPRIPGARALAG